MLIFHTSKSVIPRLSFSLSLSFSHTHMERETRLSPEAAKETPPIGDRVRSALEGRAIGKRSRDNRLRFNQSMEEPGIDFRGKQKRRMNVHGIVDRSEEERRKRPRARPPLPPPETTRPPPPPVPEEEKKELRIAKKDLFSVARQLGQQASTLRRHVRTASPRHTSTTTPTQRRNPTPN